MKLCIYHYDKSLPLHVVIFTDEWLEVLGCGILMQDILVKSAVPNKVLVVFMFTNKCFKYVTLGL